MDNIMIELITYSIKADTPEETRAQIVEWLRDQSVNHSIGGRMADRKKVSAEHKAKADAYTSAADFIELIKIESKGLDKEIRNLELATHIEAEQTKDKFGSRLLVEDGQDEEPKI